MTHKSVKKLTDCDLCYQCGTCSSICPTDAIKMERIIDRGLIYPKVSETKCINCSKCLKVCPINNINLEENHLPTNDNYIGVYNSTDKSRFDYTASGGLVTEMIKYLFLEKKINKAIVTGMDDKSPTNGKAYLIEDIEMLSKVSGSVYQPVAVNELLTQITDKDKVAFVGLPCHIRGLERFLTFNKKLQGCFILKIGIICSIGRGKHGTTLTLEKEFNLKSDKNIDRILYRHGMPPGDTKVYFKDGTVKSASCMKIYQNTDYLFMPKGCLFCPDLFNDKADITVGDPWGLNKGKKAMAIVRNNNARSILDEMVEKNYIAFDEELTPEQCIKTQQHSVNYKIHNYKSRQNAYSKFKVKTPFDEKFIGYNNSFKSFIGYNLLMFNSYIFNSKIGYLLMKYIPRKLIYKYRDIILSINTAKVGE